MGYRIKHKIWIESDDVAFLGGGRVRLLHTIDQLGSLSKAARQLNISYKKAWDLVKSINESSEQPITKTTTGGSGGGGMQLTPYGKKMIAQFEELTEKADAFMNKQHFKQ